MILSFHDPEARNSHSTGGKAGALSRLLAAGFPVPPGFVVTIPDDPGLATRLAELEAIAGKDAIFAVRSSGYSEDSVESSFAGQYETILGVRGFEPVRSAIERCFASFTNLRSQAYRERRTDAGRGGAVIVQQLIDAEAAGIAFTIDPVTANCDHVLIEANFGLGESVVGGRVTPDSFRLSRETRAIGERRIADKRWRTVLSPDGSRLEAMPEKLVRQSSLTDEAVQAIGELALQVEQQHGVAVDIEWAWKNGKVWLLQARPVTAAGRSRQKLLPPPSGWKPELNTLIDPRFPLYSNGNLSEILPGCITPLTYSLVYRELEQGFRHMTESVGSMPKIDSGHLVVGFFYHRLYLNASYFMAAADNSPGASRDRVYEDLIGPSPIHHPAWRWNDFLPWRLWHGLRLIGRYLGAQGNMEKDMSASRKHYQEALRRLERPATDWTEEELAAWLVPAGVRDEHLTPGAVHIRVSQFATSSFASLRGMTKRWLNDCDGTLAAKLVAGIGTIAGASPAIGLYHVSRMVLNDPETRVLFESETDDRKLLLQLRGAVRSAVDDFGKQFGHRGFREADFRFPNWGEQPELVVGMVRRQLASVMASPYEAIDRQSAMSAVARTSAVAKLKGWRRIAFTAVLASARKHIAAREQTKDLVLRFVQLNRRVFVIVQERLKGLIADPDDMHFLLASEVAAALRGKLSGPEIAALVKRRRQDFDWSSQVYVPKIQNGVVVCLERPEGESANGLKGISVSPGRVEGRARVVLDPTSATIQAGEILVAPVTDVAWTPLFLHAAALVVEVGGPLSHGSIVAREYGIPAVTAVAGATTAIHNGDWIQVDGDHGTITIVKKA